MSSLFNQQHLWLTGQTQTTDEFPMMQVNYGEMASHLDAAHSGVEHLHTDANGQVTSKSLEITKWINRGGLLALSERKSPGSADTARFGEFCRARRRNPGRGSSNRPTRAGRFRPRLRGSGRPRTSESRRDRLCGGVR